jgi:Raf kinase inhibitor-like YbhB/YbcL family protein
MRLLISLILTLLFATSASANKFTLKSADITSNTIPKLYTCDGGNHTPELNWSNFPAKTQSFTIVGLSYDSPMGVLYGWTIYNIPATVTSLEANVKKLPDGAMMGQNGLGESYYHGPCPGDSNLHHYAFIIYALDAALPLDADLTPKDLMRDIKSHILQEAQLKATYRH